MADTITAAMVANYLLTECDPEHTTVVLTREPDHGDLILAMEDVLADIAQEPERYKEIA